MGGKNHTGISSSPSKDVQQQRAVVDLETGGKFTSTRDQGKLQIPSFPLHQHYFWCLGTCPKIISSLWELQMLLRVENSKQEKYQKHKDIPACRQFKVPVLSFLTHKNLKLNTVKSPSESEHSQRFLASVHLHCRPVQHSTQHKLFSL